MQSTSNGNERHSLKVSGGSLCSSAVDFAIDISSISVTRNFADCSAGSPGPDFPSGEGESQHLGRLMPDYIIQNINIEAQRSLGLARFDDDEKGVSIGERKMLTRANEILRFA